LGIQDRIRVGDDFKVSDKVLEDVVEAIAGAILEELGYPALYRRTEVAFGPIIESIRGHIRGMSQLSSFCQVRS
jgi:dsRNA-specific ribonuclease